MLEVAGKEVASELVGLPHYKARPIAVPGDDVVGGPFLHQLVRFCEERRRHKLGLRHERWSELASLSAVGREREVGDCMCDGFRWGRERISDGMTSRKFANEDTAKYGAVIFLERAFWRTKQIMISRYV